MHIQLIHPPVYLNLHAMTALRPSLPLGLAYIGASLRKAGHHVSMLDAVGAAPTQVTPDGRLHRLGLTPDEIVARLDPTADAFGLTNMWSFSWPIVREIIHKLKERFPGKPLVCGGEHFTGLAEHSLQTAPIDYIVLGEGEDCAVALFSALEQKDAVDAIAGIAFMRDGVVVRTAPPVRKRDIDELPWPAWDLVDMGAYNDNNLVNGVKWGTMVPILATRGCPYQCTFCASPNMWTTRYYMRNPLDVANEIEHYNKVYGATNFPFQDLTALVKRGWIIEFCSALIDKKLDITWQFPSGTRCEVIDDDVARLLRLTGGRSLAYAPESGSERTRELIQKRMKTESLLNAVRASVRNKLNITCFFVLGFPQDEASDLRATRALVRKLAWLGIDDIAIGFFFPIPNTQLHRELLENGRIRNNNEDAFLLTPILANEMKLTEDHNYCEKMSARELTWWKYRLLLNFYGISFGLRPWRIAKVVVNALRGKETRKLETYLVELRRKLRIGFGRRKQTA